tara:strand:- start:55 stop:804 length:750 start_codon:yes stop_codon:yes gene_type:complete
MSYSLTAPINNTVGFKMTMTLYQDIRNAELAGNPLSLEIINKRQAEIIEVCHKDHYDMKIKLEEKLGEKNIKCIELEDEIDEKDKNIIELEDDCDKLEKARVKKSLKTIALKKKNKKDNDKLLEKIKELEETVKKLNEGYNADSSEEEEDEEDEELSYEDDDNWYRPYGCIMKEGGMTYTMAGGGSHWWQYVITKSGVFTNSQSGHYPIKGKLVSSPNGDYLCEKDKDYELKEREIDMYYKCIDLQDEY